MTTEHGVQQTSERRTFVTAVVAAAAGVLGTVLAGFKRAEAGHDGSNIFHIRESNDGGTQTTSLIRDLTAPTLKAKPFDAAG